MNNHEMVRASLSHKIISLFLSSVHFTKHQRQHASTIHSLLTQEEDCSSQESISTIQRKCEQLTNTHTHTHRLTVPPQLQDVLEQSDKTLADVRDLFGDEPKVRNHIIMYNPCMLVAHIYTTHAALHWQPPGDSGSSCDY